MVNSPGRRALRGSERSTGWMKLFRDKCWGASGSIRFACGEVTDCYLTPDISAIHSTREAMLLQVLEPLFEGQWEQPTAVDPIDRR